MIFLCKCFLEETTPVTPGPEVIFPLLIKTKILKNNKISCFQTLTSCFHHTNKC